MTSLADLLGSHNAIKQVNALAIEVSVTTETEGYRKNEQVNKQIVNQSMDNPDKTEY